MNNMKKYILCFVLFCTAFFLYAQEGEARYNYNYNDNYDVDYGDDPDAAPVPAANNGDDSDVGFVDNFGVGFVENSGVSDEDNSYAGDSEPAVQKKSNPFLGFLFGAKSYLNNADVTTAHNESRRAFDLGLFDLRVGVSNNLLSVGDILKKELVLDMDVLVGRVPNIVGLDFVGLDVAFDLNFFDFQFNAKKGWGFGIDLARVTGDIDIHLPRSILALLADGNQGENRDITDSFTIAGSVFYELGFNSHFNIKVAGKPLRLDVDPAFYAPIVYIPTSGIKYHLKTDNTIEVEAGGEFTLYSVIDFNNPGRDFDIDHLPGGFDISANAEYPLFTRLDVGASISRIPIVPAALKYGMQGSLGPITVGPINGVGDLLDIEDLINIPDPPYELGDYKNLREGKKPLYIVRPVRFDFYVLYRPLKDDFLVIRPNIGWTLPTASSPAYFNGSAEVQLHAVHHKKNRGYLLNLYFNTGIEEGLWRNRLGLEINLHAFELDIEVGLRSESYAGSFDVRGAEVRLGMRFGF
ncbi:hypothetical protein AGMMS49991_01730 [Spirochaetia bacterium]|nr:hypothetical protein AGMMS49991_01730 [Spirochaetia bacterium]